MITKISALARKSLAGKMLLIILVAWIIPVLLLITISGSFMVRQTRTHTIQTIERAHQTATEVTQRTVEEFLQSSFKASYLPTLKEAWKSYNQDGDIIKLYERVTEFLNYHYKYDNNFLNTMIVTRGPLQRIFYTTNISNNGQYQGVKDFGEYLWMEVLEESETLGTQVMVKEHNGQYYFIRNLMDYNYNPYAIFVAQLNMGKVFDSLTTIPWADDISVSIGEGQYIVAGESFVSKPENLLFQQVKMKGSGFCVSDYFVQNGLRVEYFAQGNAQNLSTQMMATLLIWAGTVLLLFPLIGVVVVFFMKEVNSPVQVLRKASGEIKQGNFGFAVNTQEMKNDDFHDLASSFNEMSDTLKNQFERIYKEEIALKDAQIMALQSQINPHFLNNTLEIINWEARIGGNLKVCKMIESLSIMLNAAMDRKKNPTIHLSEEMMYVDAYLYVIGERLGNRLTVKREIDPDLMDCYVPRLVLQPILENAVIHGITPTQKGTITIRAYQEEDNLVLEVENDGVTTYQDLMKIKNILEDSSKTTSVGLKNVHQRLKILYGPENKLIINLTQKGNLLTKINVKLEQNGQ